MSWRWEEGRIGNTTQRGKKRDKDDFIIGWKGARAKKKEITGKVQDTGWSRVVKELWDRRHEDTNLIFFFFFVRGRHDCWAFSVKRSSWSSLLPHWESDPSHPNVAAYCYLKINIVIFYSDWRTMCRITFLKLSPVNTMQHKKKNLALHKYKM